MFTSPLMYPVLVCVNLDSPSFMCVFMCFVASQARPQSLSINTIQTHDVGRLGSLCDGDG